VEESFLKNKQLKNDFSDSFGKGYLPVKPPGPIAESEKTTDLFRRKYDARPAL
jgi:hypothetical protein